MEHSQIRLENLIHNTRVFTHIVYSSMPGNLFFGLNETLWASPVLQLTFYDCSHSPLALNSVADSRPECELQCVTFHNSKLKMSIYLAG